MMPPILLSITVFGQAVLAGNVINNNVDINQLSNGLYTVLIESTSGKNYQAKVLKK